MTAFDGPGPFDGDAVSNYMDEALVPPAAFREVIARAFLEVISGGAARHVPAELLAMAGIGTAPFYVDVDEAVWAWACAEIVATALGHEPESPIPEAILHRAETTPDPASLIPDALRALEIVADPKRSELAGLLEEANDQNAFQRMGRLGLHLAEKQLSRSQVAASSPNPSKQ